MRKIILLLFFLQGLAGNLFSQNTHSGNNSLSAKFNEYPGTEDEGDRLQLNYYDLGGHLFAGQYPINNPFNTGDTGIVFLYKVIDDKVSPVDTTQFSNLGYFLFTKLVEGKYIIKARLTNNSKHFKDYFPTYITSNMRWVTSNILELTDKSNFEANIHLIPTVDTLTGPASIKGFVVQATSEHGVETMSNAEVILFNDKMDPLTFGFSDPSGMFFFPGLPYGTYNLMAESTGKYPAFLRITLDQNHTDFDSVLLETLAHNPATIEESNDPWQSDIGPVFPNPANDNITVMIRTSEPENLNFAIFSLNGQKLISGDYQITGIRPVNIQVGSLSNGIYFLMVRSQDGQWRIVQKFVKL
jgi:hypothetical protein